MDQSNATLFYHFRNEQNNAPVVTYCLLKIGNEIARGVSICSEKTPVKEDGRDRAEERAKEALSFKETFREKVNHENAKAVFKSLNRDYLKNGSYNHKYFGKYPDIFMMFKEFYNPELTEFEEILLRIKKINPIK